MIKKLEIEVQLNVIFFHVRLYEEKFNFDLLPW
jgi:hypothetical protein